MEHKGTKVLETGRLILRPFVMEDASAMYANWASDEEVTKYLTWPPHSSQQVTETVLKDWISGYSKDDFYQWAIVLKENGQEPVGSISVVSQIPQAESVHIGYCIGRNFWRRGITSEAMGEVIRFFMEEVKAKRLDSRHDPRNPGSGGVMRKCGMRRVGVMKKSDVNNQGVCDAVYYELLAEDYFAHLEQEHGKRSSLGQDYGKQSSLEQDYDKQSDWKRNYYKKNPWLKWAVDIQSIAQNGLAYVRDVYDKERYEQLREIAADMLSYKTGISQETVKGLFCNETGYQTPKLDSRAAVFRDDKILLVHEKNGTWSLPGGWVDVLESVASNTVKEVREEAGLLVTPERVIAVQDRNQHNLPVYAYGVCKVFLLCREEGGSFQENIETTEIGYFSEDHLPQLAEEKCNEEQIRMCFAAYRDPHWQVQFD